MSETPEINVPDDEALVEEETPKRFVGFKTLGIAALAASLLGAMGGAGLSTLLNAPMPNISPLETKVDDLAKENAALKAQISQLKKDIKSVPKTNTVDLSAIRSRLGALENAEPQVIDPDLIDRLEALNEEGSEALDLSDIYSRLETLEKRPAVIERLTTSSSKAPQSEVGATFPKDVIIAALDTEAVPKSWLQKTLKKHISVQSEDNPHYLVELIEADIEKGDMRAAVAKFDKLPESVKAAAKAWRNAVEEQ